MAFWNKKITSDEYSDLSAKIIKLSSDVAILNSQFERIETRFKVLHSRLNKIKDDEVVEDDNPNSQISPQQLQQWLLGLGNGKE